MYEKIAWDNFIKTGSIESFMEYKRLLELNSSINNKLNDVSIKQNVGEMFDETCKSEGDSYKGNLI